MSNLYMHGPYSSTDGRYIIGTCDDGVRVIVAEVQGWSFLTNSTHGPQLSDEDADMQKARFANHMVAALNAHEATS